MTIKKRTVLVCFILLIIIVTSSFLIVRIKATQVSDKTNIPLILIPGTSANEDRFDDFIGKMIKKVGKEDILKIEVQKDGALSWTSSLKKHSINPYIVISFEDNSEEAVCKQAQWIKIALKKAHDLYLFDAYNALGHSNGGLAWTIYLEQEPCADTQEMKNLVTIGTPFDVEMPIEKTNASSTSVNTTNMLEKLVAGKGNIPKSLGMIAIAGDSDNQESDGVVSVESALASCHIFKDQVASYREKKFYGAKATHSELIDSPEVMSYVIDELY